jgi:pimeloyl-ACP methyl ester carboxylesterase
VHFRALATLSVAAAAASIGGAFAACSSSSSGTTPQSEAGTDSGQTPTFLPEVACSDSVDAIYADPGDVSTQPKGAILKCAHDRDVLTADLEVAARAADDAGTPGYSGKPFTSGARIYRVLYRTERGDPNNTPGYSSALVLLPDHPAALQSPVVVASHGSRGQAGKCAPSKLDPAASDVNPDFIHQVYPLVGAGLAVIAPDLAGYANFGGAKNPPSAYADVADVGKSTLDGARAMRVLVPSSVTKQNVLVGHSQGGGTALGALALADTYGSDLTIAGVAVYAPLWFSQRAWGAIFVEPANFAFSQSSAGAVSLWYFYTHGELLDGPGHGTDLIIPAKQPIVKSFVDNDCWSPSYPDLEDGGASANDYFLPQFSSSFGPAAISECSDADATCATWLGRMQADRPHLSATEAKVPTLILYANNDTTITPDLMACVVDRLTTDKSAFTFCYDADPVGHGGIVTAKADYVAEWVLAQAAGGPAPQACTHDQSALVDDAGVKIPCNPLLPQD